jgi:hypothetical protein
MRIEGFLEKPTIEGESPVDATFRLLILHLSRYSGAEPLVSGYTLLQGLPYVQWR